MANTHTQRYLRNECRRDLGAARVQAAGEVDVVRHRPQRVLEHHQRGPEDGRGVDLRRRCTINGGQKW